MAWTITPPPQQDQDQGSRWKITPPAPANTGRWAIKPPATAQSDTTSFPYDKPGVTYGGVLPFARDDKTGKTSLAVPEIIRSPLRGAISLGQEALGKKPMKDPLADPGSDEFNAMTLGVTGDVAGAFPAAKTAVREGAEAAAAKIDPAGSDAGSGAATPPDLNVLNARGVGGNMPPPGGGGKPPGPIAPEGPLSRPPAVDNPRAFEDQLHQLQTLNDADRIDVIKKLQAVPKGTPPETWEKIYHSEEDTKGVPLTPEEQALNEQHVKPVAEESGKLYHELESLGYPEMAEEDARPDTEGYTPRYAKGRTRSFGEVLEQWKKGVEVNFGGAAGRSLRKTVDAQKSRRFFKAVNSKGDAEVVYVSPDGDIHQFTGEDPNRGGLRPGNRVRAADRGNIGTVLSVDGGKAKVRFVSPEGATAHKEFPVDQLENLGGNVLGKFSGRFEGQPQKKAPGAKFQADGTTWRLENATTKEIESVAKVRYSKNVLANRLDQLAKLRSAVRNAKFIEGVKSSPDFDRIGVKISDEAVPPKTGGRTWRSPKLLQFRQYWMDPKIADALDDFAGDMGTVEGLAAVGSKLGRALNWAMFLNPKAHIDNVFNHMMVEGGAVGNIIHMPSNFKNLMKAAKEVSTAGPTYMRMLKAGASLPYSKMLSADLHETLIKQLGGEVQADPAFWSRAAQTLGYRNLAEMVGRLSRVPQKVLWYASDIMTLSRIMAHAERGRSIEEAIAETERHMPNYRVPGQVAGSRFAAEVFKNPVVGRFGRYQYGRLAGYFRMLRGAFGPGAGMKDRAQDLDRLVMLGLYLALFYPMIDKAWQHITGNPNAKTVRSGAAAVPQAAMDVVKGDKSIGDMAQSVFTLGAPLETFPELYYGRYSWDGQPIIRDADVRAGRWGTVAKDAGSYAASKLSGIGQMVDPEGKKSMGQVGLGMLGVNSPTAEQVRNRKYYKQRDAREAARRARKMESRQ